MSAVPDSANSSAFVDLHSHTNESDGTLTPGELIVLAKRIGLDGLAITDHDTFAGYEQAIPLAREARLDLLCGIELNSRLKLGADPAYRSVHLLAYFPSQPSKPFFEWLEEQREDRRTRNLRLTRALQDRGVAIEMAEVEARGKSLAGRPHFAQILVEKGYAHDPDDAFQRYIGEEAPSYVERQSQTTEEAIQTIRDGVGIPVVAHPVRLNLSRNREREVLVRLKQAGLVGLEIYHSEHSSALQAHYEQIAEELDLLPTGGSDFHGRAKPNVALGTGMHGNLRVPRKFLDGLRDFVPAQ